MERRREKHEIGLFDSVLIGNELVPAGVFDRCTERSEKVGRRKQKKVIFRRVGLQKETYDPRKTLILVPFHLRQFEVLDRTFIHPNPKYRQNDYDPNESAFWEDRRFPYLYKDDPRWSYQPLSS